MKVVYTNARELYGKLLNIYYHDYNDILDEEKERVDIKHNPKNLLIKGQRFIEDEEKRKLQPEKTTAERVKLKRQKTYDEEGDDSDEFIDILPLESYEEQVKERKELEVLTPNFQDFQYYQHK